MKVAVFDTKPYDRTYFKAAAEGSDLELVFFENRLRPETVALTDGCEAVCAFVNDHLDRETLGKLQGTGTRHVAMRCAGFNNIDLDAASELGITVSRVPGYSPHAVAEHTVALLLGLVRRIPKAVSRVKEHNFTLNGLVGFDLHGKSAGIIGAGTIGRILAEILKGFGMTVSVHDPSPDKEWAEKAGIQVLELDELIATSDVISLHVPLMPETHHLLDQEAFSQMKQGAIVLNTGRGKLIDTAALVDALKSRHLGGVALDVYEEEEGVFFEDLSGEILDDDLLSRLLTFPNVLITSHQAFLTDEALTQIATITCDNLTRVSRDESLIDGTKLA